MNKFKVGDLVECTNSLGYVSAELKLGGVYTVSSTDVDDHIRIVSNFGNNHWYSASRFKLVSPPVDSQAAGFVTGGHLGTHSLRAGADVILPTGPQSTQTAVRDDAGKPDMSLLDADAMEGTAAVLSFGAKKYAKHNWKKGMPWGRVIGSMLRHTFKFMSGEDVDKESGLPHVDHIACNAMFLQNYYRNKKNLDDRFKDETK